MKRLACIVVSICSAVAACSGNDPFDGKKGRVAGPRFTGGRYEACCRPAEVLRTCDGKVSSRRDAQALLLKAHDECLDTAFIAVKRYAREDLAAAYFIRAQRRKDPVDFLRALDSSYESESDVALFNRALVQEKFRLTREAIASYDQVRDPEWSAEARRRRDALNVTEPQWRPERLQSALQQRDYGAVRRVVDAFPLQAIRYFEEAADPLDFVESRLLADALAARAEPYARAIVEAAAATRDRAALTEGIRVFREARRLEKTRDHGAARDAYARAAALFEGTENPLVLSARYGMAACRFRLGEDPLPILKQVASAAMRNRYRDLTERSHILQAITVEHRGRYFEAHEHYDVALAAAQYNPTTKVAVLVRRSANHTTAGNPEEAFRNAFEALQLLAAVPDLNARHQAYGSAAGAALTLGYPAIALQFQNAAVATIRTRQDDPVAVNHHLAVALRARANLHVQLGNDDAATSDLEEALRLAITLGDEPLLRMRIVEVTGEAALKENPADAVRKFTEAIELAEEQNPTYRAVLHYKRAAARQKANDPKADEDIAEALKILRAEAEKLLDHTQRGKYQGLWTPYFSRFQNIYREMIRSRIEQRDIKRAFIYAEQARAFEPMYLVLQARSAAREFRAILTPDDLDRHLQTIPEDTVILQYLVLDERTYTWVLTRGDIQLVQQSTGTNRIEAWLADIAESVKHFQSPPIVNTMFLVHQELFAEPLSIPAARSRQRVVIVPDGPMHGLPFNAMRGKTGGYLIANRSIATAGSTSLYLYALHRDRQFPMEDNPDALIVGDPTLDLQHAREEALQLERAYMDSQLLLGTDATVGAFLESAKEADIIHFAGHGIVNPTMPWLSKLLLAPDANGPGDLTAERLMAEVPELEHTRLVVIGACSSAGGSPVGPEGLAPLVRPLIAANVPAVVGSLWKVDDDTTKQLLVSLHCHYRNGDDVAVALQHAQLEMLRNEPREVPARTWAAFQAVGYAGSPYAAQTTKENTHSEHVCLENPLHRPDGLHPQ